MIMIMKIDLNHVIINDDKDEEGRNMRDGG